MFAAGEDADGTVVGEDGDGEGDVAIVEVELEGAEDASLDLRYLILRQLILYGDFNGWEGGDAGDHVLHAGRKTTVLLGHAVAHGEPLELEVVVSELLRFLLLGSGSGGLADGRGSIFKELVPRGANGLLKTRTTGGNTVES